MSRYSSTDGATVGLVLMKSEEAQAVREFFAESRPDIRVEDHGTYLLFETEGEIRVPVVEVAEFLGRSLSVSEFLVCMSSYYGRANVEDEAFVLTSEMTQLEHVSN